MFNIINMKISVITPVYNREDCIERCMKSVEESIKYILNNRGSYFDDIQFEQIVVDDGSKDNTPQIVQQYANCHSWLRFISFPKNKGTNAARNAAIKAAKGDWCIILDSDDYFLPTALETIISVMQKHEGYKHYMFAPDDMQPYYEQNQILKGCKEKALLYLDFLNGYIGGDFIHCHMSRAFYHDLYILFPCSFCQVAQFDQLADLGSIGAICGRAWTQCIAKANRNIVGS